jgi:hypothetical protein
MAGMEGGTVDMNDGSWMEVYHVMMELKTKMSLITNKYVPLVHASYKRHATYSPTSTSTSRPFKAASPNSPPLAR